MNYYNEIKNELINNEINRMVKEYSINKSDLNTYYNVGKLIIEAQGGESRAKYGNQLIKEHSKKLSEELGSGYSERFLKDMRKFFLFIKKGHAVHAQLSWNHYIILITLNNENEILYYINTCLLHNYNKRQLQERIIAREYEVVS